MQDPIYEFAKTIEVDNIVLDIIKTPEFIRLKGIKQGGITGLFTVRTYDRAEHSLGVYYLLKFLGATLEQCIGGLLHDIYHTNFSHTTDELFCGENQESFHEKNKYVFFERCCGNIKKILYENFPNRSVNYFLDGENLLVTKNKSFGADMLDYFMRDGFYEGIIGIDWIETLISKLKLVDGRIILGDVNMAREFFNKTIHINDTVYMSPFSRGQYKIFMNILKLAIDNEVITTDMLTYGYMSDSEVYNIIKRSSDPKIKELIILLETTTEYAFHECGGRTWKKLNALITRKLRFLNPLCEKERNKKVEKDDAEDREEAQLISEIDADVKRFLMEKREQYEHREELYVGTDLDVCDL